MRKTILIFCALIVLATIGAIAYVRLFTLVEPKLTTKLSDIVPEQWEGWTITELPLAETEGMRQYVGNFLKFDQYISRILKKGNLEVVFYVAYWEPNKRTPFDAGGHNPDSCWVATGWQRSIREYSVSGKTIENRTLIPFEYGVYSKDDTSQPVIFWHLVNGHPFNYKSQKMGGFQGLTRIITRANVYVEDFKRLGLNQRREQMFIRISFPNQDMEEVWANPDFHQLLLSVDKLGIFADQPWQ